MRRAASYRRHFLLLSAGIATVTLALAKPAFAQITSREGIELQNQIQQLGQQLNQIQSSSGNVAAPAPSPSGGNAQNGDLVAQLLDRVSQLESQMRDMRGELDQLNNQVQTQNAAMSKKLDDMQFAAQNGAGAAPSSSAAGVVGPAAAAGNTPQKPKSALDLLQAGQGALRSGDYATAQADGQAALKSAKTPQGKMDSQFLVAQSLAGQKQYRDSALAYYDAYKRAPHSARAAEALLGVSASMLALNDKKSACEALEQLKAEFPNPAPKVKAAATSFRTRAACH